MHDLKRLPRFRRLPPAPGPARPASAGAAPPGHLAPDRLQPLQQRPGDHPVSHIRGPGRPGDHHQHPQPTARHRHRLRPRRHRQAPAIPPASPAPAAAPAPGRASAPTAAPAAAASRPEHQLQSPRVPRPLGRHPAPGRPRTPTRTPARPTQPAAPGSRGPRSSVHPERRLQVILQIPAQILQASSSPAASPATCSRPSRADLAPGDTLTVTSASSSRSTSKRLATGHSARQNATQGNRNPRPGTELPESREAPHTEGRTLLPGATGTPYSVFKTANPIGMTCSNSVSRLTFSPARTLRIGG